MNSTINFRVIIVAVALVIAANGQPRPAAGQQSGEIPAGLGTPDELKSPVGTLEFTDGAPTEETARKVRDMLDLIRGVNVYNNSFRGASAYAIRQGFHGIGADDNTVVLFSELMDAKSLFLTANADTVYYLAAIDLTKGPMVLEQPPRGLGTINDMWFSWIIDIGFPGPDRGEGGKYLLVPPGHDGPLPEGGFFVAHSRTDHVLYAARSFLVDNDPGPAVENIKQNLKIYPYTPGGFGTSIAEALEGQVRLAKNPPAGETKFMEVSGKAFNTIPPSDYAYTLDSPGMIMRIPGVGSQYLMGFLDSEKQPFDGGKTYRVKLPQDIPAERFWSLTLYDNQTRSMLDTPQRFPRAGSQSYPSPAAEVADDGSTTVYFGPRQPDGVARGNWIQTVPGKGWFTILRLYSPKESFFTKKWQPSEIELVE